MSRRLVAIRTGGYACSGCGASFANKAMLNAHFDRGHPSLSIAEWQLVLDMLDYNNTEAARAIEVKIIHWNEGDQR